MNLGSAQASDHSTCRKLCLLHDSQYIRELLDSLTTAESRSTDRWRSSTFGMILLESGTSAEHPCGMASTVWPECGPSSTMAAIGLLLDSTSSPIDPASLDYTTPVGPRL